ncbi:MAG: enoyl-CoA hydratase/isomerase family protein [Chloroflexi bacterium]|nr:enoyl-CoA hydratase/isomerase family protein [Chloroflexota bacterium]
MSFGTLLFDVRDGVARVGLNRPRALNAFNIQMRDELFEVLSAVRDDPDVRVLALYGEGTAFCAGADLTEFGTAPSPTAARRIRFARDVWALLADLEVPAIAALHGYTLGSGFELALLCDLRLAARGTVFGLPEVRLGMIPAAGGTQSLPRVCGISRALDLLLTGRRFDADEAERLGIVGRVVPPEHLRDETAALARQLASQDAAALRAIKRAVREGADLPLAQGLRLEAVLAARLRAGVSREP